MTTITIQGNPTNTIGELPDLKTAAPSFKLTGTDLTDMGLEDFPGQKIVLNIFPSIDTTVCAASVRRFNKEASLLPDATMLCISADLPFAHQRFCEIEGLEDVIPLSVFRSPGFGRDYGVLIVSGPMAGLLSRAIVIIDKGQEVQYTEQVMEIAQEPDYESAMQALINLS